MFLDIVLFQQGERNLVLEFDVELLLCDLSELTPPNNVRDLARNEIAYRNLFIVRLDNQVSFWLLLHVKQTVTSLLAPSRSGKCIDHFEQFSRYFEKKSGFSQQFVNVRGCCMIHYALTSC